MGGFAPGADEDAGLIPVLNGAGDIGAHAAAARRAGVPRRAILACRNGMARLGLAPANWPARRSPARWRGSISSR